MPGEAHLRLSVLSFSTGNPLIDLASFPAGLICEPGR